MVYYYRLMTRMTMHKRRRLFTALGVLGGGVSAAFTLSCSGSLRRRSASEVPQSVWAQTSIWGSEGLPEVADSGDAAPIEVGVKFRSHAKGWITAVRFYKARANTGVHIGTLWSDAGDKLASATFTHETLSGWQQADFANPVSIEANTTYVASYHTNAGHYSADPLYFVAGRDNGTLEALDDDVEGGNGVYNYSKQSTFPSAPRNGANYWVDVVLVPARVPRGDTYLPWACGSAYYRRWSNGPSPNGNPGYFPIGVWYQNPSNARGYRALGINLFVALPKSPTQTFLTELAAAHMSAYADQNRIGLTASHNSPVKAWMQIDEPDNAQPLPSGGYGPCLAPSVIVERYENFRKNDPTRPVYLGVGKSVDNTAIDFRGVCTGHYGDYPIYLQGADIVSYDGYPVNTSVPLWYVAKGMDYLRAWVNYKKPAYEAIETTRIQAKNPKPSPDLVKSEVWMVLIHGGMGILYFCHVFTPKLDGAALLHDPVMSGAVAALDREIASLARVLNTPSVANGVRVTSSNALTPVDVMLKRWKDSTYLFAIASRPGGPTTATFALRGFPQRAVGSVLEENRQIKIANGIFRDDFSKEYQVHIYRMTYNPASR
jgi:Domain of unknown function (DUF4082)